MFINGIATEGATLPPPFHSTFHTFLVSSLGMGREIPLLFPNVSNVPTPIYSLIAIVMGLISL